MCGSVLSKTVYLGAPLCETVSPGQVHVSACLALTLSLGSLAWICASASVYPPPCVPVCLSVALFISVSLCVPISESIRVSLVSRFSPSLFLCVSLYQSLCVSFSLSLCVWVSCVSVSLSSPLCVRLSPWTCLYPLSVRSVSVVLWVSCVSLSLCVCLFLPGCVSVSVCVYVSSSPSLVFNAPHARGGRAPLT